MLLTEVWNALVGGKILLKISSGESSQCNSNWFTTWHRAYPQLAGHCTGLQHGGTFSWDKNYDFTWVLSTKETKVSNSTILTSKLASVSVTFPSGCSSFPGTQQSHKLSWILYSLSGLYNDESNRGCIDFAKVFHIFSSACLIKHSTGGMVFWAEIEIFPTLNFLSVPMSSGFFRTYLRRFRISDISAYKHLKPSFGLAFIKSSPHHITNQATPF